MKRYTLKIGLISLILFFIGNIVSAQTLITDRLDYPPGDTAILTGAGFQPGENIVVQVLHYDGTSDGGADHQPWEVTADSSGNFITTWHVCEDDCVGSTLRATADGQLSGLHAEAIFTDALRTDTYPLSFTPFSGTSTYCQGASASNLTASWGNTSCNGINSGSNTNLAITITWYKKSDSIPSGGTPVQATNTNAGTTSTTYNPPTSIAGTLFYYVTVSWGSGTNCAAAGSITTSATKKVIVGTVPAAVTGGAKTICSGSSTVLGAASVSGNSYVWSPATGLGSAFVSNPTANPTVNTTYTLVETTTATGCAKSNTAAVTVNTAPVVSLSSTNINKSAAHGLCSNTVSFSNNASATGTPAPTISYSPLSGSSFSVGTTTVTATATNSCGVDSKTFTVTVTDDERPTANPPANITQNTDPGQCYATVNLGTPTTSDNCGIQSVTNNAPAHFPVGTTTVTWTVTDVNGNTKTPTQSVTITDNENPNAITKNITVQLNTLGSASMVAADIDNGSNDPCGIKSISASKTSFNCSDLGANTVVLTVTDNNDNVSTANVIVTVADTIKPIVSCPVTDSVYRHLDPYSITYTIQGTEFNATASDNCAIETLSYELEGATTGTGTSLAGVALNNGTTIVEWTAIDSSGNEEECYFYIGIGTRPTTLTINQPTPSITFAQYSDSIPLRAELVDYNGLKVYNKPIVFQVGTQTFPAVNTDINGLATLRVKLDQNPNTTVNDNVIATFAGDATYSGSSDTDPFNVIRENAIATYTGTLFANTATTDNASTANVLLKAYVVDTADASRGNIGNASVTFKITDEATSAVFGPFTVAAVPVNNANPIDGYASYLWTPSVGSGYSRTFSVEICVGNYYIGKDVAEVTISKPTPDFVTGGGYIKPLNTSPTNGANADSKNNFGFGVKFNKGYTNLQGNFNTIIRRGNKIYHVKSNSPASLTVNSTATPKTSVMTFKNVVLQEIENDVVIWSEGNCNTVVEVTDNGEPGTTDQISIIIRKKNGDIWYSNCNSTGSCKQLLNGGNIQIITSASRSEEVQEATETSPDSVQAISDTPDKEGPYAIKVFPNPTDKSSITVSITGYVAENKPVQLYIFDITGKSVYSDEKFCIHNCNETILNLDGKYSSGTYLVDIVIEDKIYHQKLIIQ
jgi:hypothetical protein